MSTDPTIHLLRQPNPPKWRRAPFLPGRARFGAVVGKGRAHIVQQHIGIGPNQLKALLSAIL